MRLALPLIVAGCQASDPTAGEDPSIAILSPVEGAVVCGTPLEVKVEVTGIELVDPFPPEGTEPEEGTGHIDLSLNGQEADDWMFGGESLVVDGVEDGETQLKVELSNADHTPLEPYAGDFIYITIDHGACE